MLLRVSFVCSGCVPGREAWPGGAFPRCSAPGSSCAELELGGARVVVGVGFGGGLVVLMD